jgi:hypothetical protein
VRPTLSSPEFLTVASARTQSGEGSISAGAIRRVPCPPTGSTDGRHHRRRQRSTPRSRSMAALRCAWSVRYCGHGRRRYHCRRRHRRGSSAGPPCSHGRCTPSSRPNAPPADGPTSTTEPFSIAVDHPRKHIASKTTSANTAPIDAADACPPLPSYGRPWLHLVRQTLQPRLTSRPF